MSFGVRLAACRHCNHRWSAVFPEQVESLECPTCGGQTSINEMDDILTPPLHLVISRYDNATYLKVSRPCERLYLVGLLAEALAMATSTGVNTVRPEDCELSVMLSVAKPE